jgi:hypothetical protein
MSDIPTTITEAEKAGWDSLEARCEKCRVSVHMPWRLLRMRSKSDELGYIMQHAVCERCGLGKKPDAFALVRAKYRGGGSPTIERLVLR